MDRGISAETLTNQRTLLAEIYAPPSEQQRSAEDAPRDRAVPAYVRERNVALDLIEGDVPRRLACKVSEMSDAELEAIGNVETHARHNHLDAELT